MSVRKNVLACALLLLPVAALAQASNQCTSGSVVSSQYALTGQTCSPVASPLGTYIQLLSQTAAFSSQTICDTTSTCPAGFFALYVYIRPVATGTLVSSVTPTMTFTDDVGLVPNMAMGAALSLLATNPGNYVIPFYHAANTAVTVNTSTTTLTGSPTFNFRARLVWLGS